MKNGLERKLRETVVALKEQQFCSPLDGKGGYHSKAYTRGWYEALGQVELLIHHYVGEVQLGGDQLDSAQ